MTDTSKRRSTPRPAKVKAVLEAARQQFLVHGFSATTTDMVQQASGVSKATLYNCFPNKEALFAAVVDEQCEKFQQSLWDIAASDAHDSLSSHLLQMGKTYLNLLLNNDGLAFYRTMVAEAGRFPQLAELFYRSGPHTTRLLFQRCFDDYQVKVDGVDNADLAMTYFSVLRGEAQTYCLLTPDYTPSAEDIECWASRAVNIVMRIID